MNLNEGKRVVEMQWLADILVTLIPSHGLLKAVHTRPTCNINQSEANKIIEQ